MTLVPDMVKRLYVGVNDVLTSNASLSRKEIEAERAARRRSFGGLAQLAGLEAAHPCGGGMDDRPHARCLATHQPRVTSLRAFLRRRIVRHRRLARRKHSRQNQAVRVQDLPKDIAKQNTGRTACFGRAGCNRLVVGLGMLPRGEVGLIFLGLGTQAGLLTPPLEAAILLMVIGTTFLAPILLRRVLSKQAAGAEQAA
mgnify:CR=1 FL=1